MRVIATPPYGGIGMAFAMDPSMSARDPHPETHDPALAGLAASIVAGIDALNQVVSGALHEHRDHCHGALTGSLSRSAARVGAWAKRHPVQAIAVAVTLAAASAYLMRRAGRPAAVPGEHVDDDGLPDTSAPSVIEPPLGGIPAMFSKAGIAISTGALAPMQA